MSASSSSSSSLPSSSYAENQQRLVAYIQRTRSLVAHVGGMAPRLTYPTAAISSPSSTGSPAKRRPSSPARPEALNVLSLDLPADQVPEDSLAPLLARRLTDVHAHLGTLAQRVVDPTCRILVTGDLNAGKSTFVNALLRRPVLPVDQQPLTAVFTEVLDVKHNPTHPREEVHAYSSETTDPAVFATADLDSLVANADQYELLEVYCAEHEPDAEPSVLVGSDAVDVRLIDSPGLNRDVWQTMALFAQQREIDVIVFVVSAENHFTLSSREFLERAGQEKAYIFVVVNKFDAIRDKDRCRRSILQQIQALSPHTYDHREKLVHFVSAEAMLQAIERAHALKQPTPQDEAVAPDQDDVDDVDQFVQVERALKEFTLEKRAASKLSPAKRYLSHLLADIELLMRHNVQRARTQVHVLEGQVHAMQPQTRDLEDRKAEAVRDMTACITTTAGSAAQCIQSRLGQQRLESRLAECAHGVQWRGLRFAPTYVRDVHAALHALVKSELDAAHDLAMREIHDAWQTVASLHSAWMADAVRLVPDAPNDPLVPLTLPLAPPAQLYPPMHAVSLHALVFPMLPKTPLTEWPRAVVVWAAGLTWANVSPTALVGATKNLLTSTSSATASSLSLIVTGTSFLTSRVLSARPLGHDLVALGMRVGVRRVTAVAFVGAVAYASYASYRYLATLPAHLPGLLAHGMCEHLRETRHADHAAAHVATTARVGLAHAVGDAAAKMDSTMGRVHGVRDGMLARVRALNDLVDTWDECAQRAALIAQQVAAVRVDDGLAVPV